MCIWRKAQTESALCLEQKQKERVMCLMKEVEELVYLTRERGEKIVCLMKEKDEWSHKEKSYLFPFLFFEENNSY